MSSSPTLELPHDVMRALGHQIVDLLIDHHIHLSDGPAIRRQTPQTLFQHIDQPFPESPRPFDQVLADLAPILDSRARVDHPRFFAFVPVPGNFVGAMADALVAGLNVFAGTWISGSGPTALETVTLNWLRDELGLPSTAGGLFVSGGSMANLTALAVARHAHLHDNTQRAVVYLSDQTHSAAERALRILGLTEIRKIATGPDFRLPLPALEAAIAADRNASLTPSIVIVNAGTTNTGAIDPLEETAALCGRENLWLHVDGAYGAAAVLCEEGREALRGLGLVDSLALDPHKWLFQPLECGCVFVRHENQLVETFRILPEYLRDAHKDPREIQFCDRGIQLTRSFRALKLWMCLQVFGVQSFREAVSKGFHLARVAEARLRENPDWEVLTPAQMGIVSFRHNTKSASRLVDAMLQDGFAFLSSTVLYGQPALRMCTINPRTTEADVTQTIAYLENLEV